MYCVFEHTADLGLHIEALTREELFAEAGRALVSVLVENVPDVRPLEERRLKLAGDDAEFLFFDWLNELLYLFESEKFLACEFEVEFVAHGLVATVRGERAAAGHVLAHEVKAITYHGLKFEAAPGGWLAEVIVDI